MNMHNNLLNSSPPRSVEQFVAGIHVPGVDYEAFLPHTINGEWQYNTPLLNKLVERAAWALGELKANARLLHDEGAHFIARHQLMEAVTSSRIEGTKTEMTEALLPEQELHSTEYNDWQEVQNYSTAMAKAMEMLKTLPLSGRLICETHAVLMTGVRGNSKSPGQFRRSQNWIGGTLPSNAMFVPPLHQDIPDLMGDLELFLHNDDTGLPDLMKVAIAHYQFETIHPFLDGNGRTGRLLIVLYLIDKGLLDKPLLYMSQYLEANRSTYYQHLHTVRTEGRMVEWLVFFLTGVQQTAQHASQTLIKALQLQDETQERFTGYASGKADKFKRMVQLMFRKPVFTIKDVQDQLAVTAPTAGAMVSHMQALGLLTNYQNRKVNRYFVFQPLIDLYQ